MEGKVHLHVFEDQPKYLLKMHPLVMHFLLVLEIFFFLINYPISASIC